jgi:20S proteasome subunit beta 4
MGDSIFGFVGKDYVLLVADAVQARSIVVLTEFEDKILPLDSHKLFAMSGEHGDRIQFSQYIQKNLSLYYYRNNLELTTHAAANYTRRQLADALRQNPYQVNILLGGFDKEGPSLYFLDYLASMHKVNNSMNYYIFYAIIGVILIKFCNCKTFLIFRHYFYLISNADKYLVGSFRRSRICRLFHLRFTRQIVQGR